MSRIVVVTFFIGLFFAGPFIGDVLARNEGAKPQALNQDYRDFKREYFSNLLSEYKLKSEDPTATRRAFLALMHQFIEKKTRARVIHQHIGQLQPLAETFLAMKPEDPYSIVEARYFLMQCKNYQHTRRNIRKMYEAAERVEGHSLFVRYRVARALHESLYVAPFRLPKKSKEVLVQYQNVLFEWMSQKDPSVQLQRMMYSDAASFLDRRYPKGIKMFPLFKKKLKEDGGKLTPWLRNMLTAKLTLNQAWEARGGDYASNVTEKGWKQFHQGLAVAEKNLKAAYKIDPDRPEAATAMISVAMAGDTEEGERTWFDRAVEAEFDYIEAYDAYLISLFPRWGGSHRAMVEFAQECADTERYDTMVPLVFDTCYRTVLKQASYDAGDRRAYMESMGLYPKVLSVLKNYHSGMEEFTMEPNDTRRYFRATSLKIAIGENDSDYVMNLFREFDGDIFHPDAKLMSGYSTEYVKGKFAAVEEFGPKLAPILYAFRGSVMGMDRDLEQCEELLSQINSLLRICKDQRARLYLQTFKDLAKQEIAFHRDQWVNLTFTKDLRHWQQKDGHYKVESPTKITAFNTGNEEQVLIYNTNFAPPYEIEVTVKSVKINESSRHLYSGVICGDAGIFAKDGATGRVFCVNTFNNQVGIGTPTQTPEIATFIKPETSARLNVKVFDNYFEIGAGGVQFVHEHLNFKPGRICLGTLPWFTLTGETQYSDFRIRKLKLPPAPPEDQPEARLAYYQERMKEKTFYLGYAEISHLQMGLEKYDDAIVTLKGAAELAPNHPEPWREMSVCYEKKSEWKKAAECAEQALKKCTGLHANKRRVMLTEVLIRLLRDPDIDSVGRERSLECAKELAKRKVRSSHDDGIIGLAFANNKKFDEAIKYTRMALKKAKPERKKIHQEQLELYQTGRAKPPEDK